MKLEEQVCSLELAKKLKELGLPQAAHFNWSQRQTPDNKGWGWYRREGGVIGNGCSCAFTVAELGEMLPKWIYVCKDTTDFCAGYAMNPDLTKPIGQGMSPEMSDAIDGARTEADCRAKMLIYLLENRLIKNGSSVLS